MRTFTRALLALSAGTLTACPSSDHGETPGAVIQPSGGSPVSSGSPASPAREQGRDVPPRSTSKIAAPQPTPTSDRPPFGGTVGILETSATGSVRTLQAVRAARHPQFDRVVFEFSEGVPGYHLEYIDRPVRACGSGSVVPLPGDAWLEVRMSPAHAHDESGKPTISPPGQKTGLPNLQELRRTCDFEAVTTYVLALESPMPYRVLTLDAPPRMVVDVLHDKH